MVNTTFYGSLNQQGALLISRLFNACFLILSRGMNIILGLDDRNTGYIQTQVQW